jgi:hypothetical protein
MSETGLSTSTSQAVNDVAAMMSAKLNKRDKIVRITIKHLLVFSCKDSKNFQIGKTYYRK